MYINVVPVLSKKRGHFDFFILITVHFRLISVPFHLYFSIVIIVIKYFHKIVVFLLVLAYLKLSSCALFIMMLVVLVCL